jgi:hypothetical protein
MKQILIAVVVGLVIGLFLAGVVVMSDVFFAGAFGLHWLPVMV